jgi:hypothetical protein
VLDGIILEKQGIPAVSIVTDQFIDTGRAITEAWGLPSFRFLTMPHPIANLSEAELDERASEVAHKVVELLLEGQEIGATSSLASH